MYFRIFYSKLGYGLVQQVWDEQVHGHPQPMTAYIEQKLGEPRARMA